jgi:3-methylcrotonyl-CoA carboxylase alpha subunit
MGDKIRSKQIAREAGVPGVPGYDGADQSPEALRREALRVCLPVMVKASAGGGGKGIRKVEHEAELDGAIAAASREAQAAFGDGRLLIEKFVTRPRHVEVQVAGDKHGNIVHLFERDCSVQRANQKLIEEAPAPNLRAETRKALHDHALKLSRAISYDNLGTVEFLVDAATQGVFFLEMNTRLQVEHPVTEAITGLDLVEWQIRIAAGERLPLAQADIHCSGHAIEARLTAERADEDFRPDTGTVSLWREPDGLRVDSGVAAGSEVSPHYDSLLAKVIAHAPDREGRDPQAGGRAGANERARPGDDQGLPGRSPAEPGLHGRRSDDALPARDLSRGLGAPRRSRTAPSRPSRRRSGWRRAGTEAEPRPGDR